MFCSRLREFLNHVQDDNPLRPPRLAVNISFRAFLLRAVLRYTSQLSVSKTED